MGGPLRTYRWTYLDISNTTRLANADNMVAPYCGAHRHNLVGGSGVPEELKDRVGGKTTKVNSGNFIAAVIGTCLRVNALFTLLL